MISEIRVSVSPKLGLREQILCASLVPVDCPDKQGYVGAELEANSIVRRPELFARVITALKVVIEPVRPDIILQTPGATARFGQELAMTMGIASLQLRRDASSGKVRLPEGRQELYGSLKRAVILDPVMEDASDVNSVAGVAWVTRRTQAVLAVWDRSLPDSEPGFDLPLASLVDEYIPTRLPLASKYWSPIA